MRLVGRLTFEATVNVSCWCNKYYSGIGSPDFPKTDIKEMGEKVQRWSLLQTRRKAFVMEWFYRPPAEHLHLVLRLNSLFGHPHRGKSSLLNRPLMLVLKILAEQAHKSIVFFCKMENHLLNTVPRELLQLCRVALNQLLPCLLVHMTTDCVKSSWILRKKDWGHISLSSAPRCWCVTFPNISGSCTLYYSPEFHKNFFCCFQLQEGLHFGFHHCLVRRILEDKWGSGTESN